MTDTTERATCRSLIPAALADRLTHRITTDHPDIDHGLAERILDQTLAFLAASVASTTPLGPSDLGDIGWHTFILYTAEYADFCTRIAGRFIHHAPDDLTDTTTQRTTLAATVAAVRAAGHHVDTQLWPSAADCSTSNCSQCYAGCTDSPAT